MKRYEIAILWIAVVIGMQNCKKKEVLPAMDSDMASLELLADADRLRLRNVTSNPEQAGEDVRALMTSPEVFVRMMTLSRIENWPKDAYMPFALAALEKDTSSLVRVRAFHLAWKDIKRIHPEDAHYRELMDATVARLTDEDDELFSLACNKLDVLEDADVFSELPSIIDTAPERRLSQLFSLFCKKNLSREDVDFILAHDKQLGTAAAVCREQVARARRLKFLYE